MSALAVGLLSPMLAEQHPARDEPESVVELAESAAEAPFCTTDELAEVERLLREFQRAAQDQDLQAVARMLSPNLSPEEREEQLAAVRESLWLPMYRRYGLRIGEAAEDIDPQDLIEGDLHLKIAADTPTGDVEHDHFWLRRESSPGSGRRWPGHLSASHPGGAAEARLRCSPQAAGPRSKLAWFFYKLKLEEPKKGEYLVPPPAEAEEILTAVESFVAALDAGDPQAAMELVSPGLPAKKRRHLEEEIHDRFLRRYLYRTDLASGRPVRRPESVRSMLVVSQEEAPGSIFRYQDHGEIAVPINLHYLEAHTFGYDRKLKKYALVFRWGGPPQGGQGRWELVDTTRRDKGFWRGVGRVFGAIGAGTLEVGGGIAHDLPYLVPDHVRIHVSH